jgi:hypothetical protein
MLGASCIGLRDEPVDCRVDEFPLSPLFSFVRLGFCWGGLIISQTNMDYCTCFRYKSPSCNLAIGAGCLPRASVQVSTFSITHYSFEFLSENASLPHKWKRTFLDVQNVASARLATWQVLKLYRVHRRHPLPATREAPSGLTTSSRFKRHGSHEVIWYTD